MMLASLWLLSASGLWADDDLYASIPFRKVELPFYTFSEYTPQAALLMEYARAEIQNPEAWQALAGEQVAYEIDLVFTLYPRDVDRWRTNYYSLLNARLRNLFALDSSLRDKSIRWNMVMQTNCTTEEEAKQFFHGFVIKYRPRNARVVEEVRTPAELRELIRGNIVTRDSTVISVLDRNPGWQDMLVVMDWTGSMYQFGAQVVIWHKHHQLGDLSRVRHFVFFNDGNNKPDWQKKPGRTGGVYRAKSADLEELVSTMEYVMKKGNGGDNPENDLEALLTSLQYLEGFQEVILIADNKSAVRDMSLLSKIDRPVRVIACDVQNGQVHPHYLQLAKATGGSIHTREKDYFFGKD
jgi:hypothetical protein